MAHPSSLVPTWPSWLTSTLHTTYSVADRQDCRKRILLQMQVEEMSEMGGGRKEPREGVGGRGCVVSVAGESVKWGFEVLSDVACVKEVRVAVSGR